MFPNDDDNVTDEMFRLHAAKDQVNSIFMYALNVVGVARMTGSLLFEVFPHHQAGSTRSRQIMGIMGTGYKPIHFGNYVCMHAHTGSTYGLSPELFIALYGQEAHDQHMADIPEMYRV